MRQVHSGDRENVLGVENYCYVASARWRARRWGAHGGGERRGHIVSPRAQLVITKFTCSFSNSCRQILVINGYVAIGVPVCGLLH